MFLVTTSMPCVNLEKFVVTILERLVQGENLGDICGDTFVTFAMSTSVTYATIFVFCDSLSMQRTFDPVSFQHGVIQVIGDDFWWRVPQVQAPDRWEELPPLQGRLPQRHEQAYHAQEGVQRSVSIISFR